MAEQKDEKLTKTDNVVGVAKEDLGQTEETLAANEEFLKYLDKVCANSDKMGVNIDGAFARRMASRLEEIKAVAETIEILTGEEARDAMSGTYSYYSDDVLLEDDALLDELVEDCLAMQEEALALGNWDEFDPQAIEECDDVFDALHASERHPIQLPPHESHRHSHFRKPYLSMSTEFTALGRA